MDCVTIFFCIKQFIWDAVIQFSNQKLVEDFQKDLCPRICVSLLNAKVDH